MRLDEIDKNLANRGLWHTDFEWYGIDDPRMTLLGCLDPKPPMHRIDRAVAASVNPQVASLARFTAGVRLRFATDSPYVAVSARLTLPVEEAGLPDMTGVLNSGFDLYTYRDGQYRFQGIFRPGTAGNTVCAECMVLLGGGVQNFELNFPMFNGVDNIAIGLAQGSVLQAAQTHTLPKRFITYGSSITHGGCASRPGVSYPALLARRLDCDYINVGLSGRCCGEKEMREYLAGIPADAFILDYDHNAYTAEHLEATHLACYRALRSKQPDLPIIIVTMPIFDKAVFQAQGWWTPKRHEVIYATYRTALAEGDRNVWFVDGDTFIPPEEAQDCTFDYIHCNDTAFQYMAKGILPALKEALR